mgnify:CR=1 FL=1
MALTPKWAEEIRMEMARALVKHSHRTAINPRVQNNDKLNWLVEEVGEVARAINDKESVPRLKEELIQVAAIATAWWQSL